MNASELRIGNYVNVPREDQCPFRIDGFEFLFKDYAKVEMQVVPDVHPLTWELKNLSPIPLSPELLAKSGFIFEDLGDDSPYEWYRHSKFPLFQIWSSQPDLDDPETHWILEMADQYDIDQSHFKYLHQLQNLFHSLTGQELTINL